MKKILLIAILLATTITAQAEVVIKDNFNENGCGRMSWYDNGKEVSRVVMTEHTAVVYNEKDLKNMGVARVPTGVQPNIFQCILYIGVLVGFVWAVKKIMELCGGKFRW